MEPGDKEGILILRKMRQIEKCYSKIWDTTFNSFIDVFSSFTTRIQSILKLPNKTTVFLVSITYPPHVPLFDITQVI